MRNKKSLLSLFLLLFCLNSFASSDLGSLFNPERGSTLADIPTPEQAFTIQIKEMNNEGITLHWVIAPKTYLYQKSFEFKAKGARLGPAQMPPGDVIHDPFFGDVAVYYEGVDVYLPFLDINAPSITLDLTFQGCHEAGICYPPHTQALSIQDTGVVVNQQSKIMNILNNVSVPFALLAFFGFGFLLALTPCVLPMVPILSALILGEQQHHHPLKALYLAIVYVLAMALTYAALGAVVASLGSHLQAQLQNPIVISITASILLLMAFLLLNDKALHKLQHLNKPLVTLSNGFEGGKFLGVALMGAISALVISPCVTPPLVGALTYITVSGDVLLGASALFALAIGMGVPLIAVTWCGTAILPKRGGWMEHIKHIFSVLLIGMAIYLFARFLPGNVVLGLWGILFIGIALWIGFWPLRKSAIERLWQGAAWVALIYGAMSIVGAGMGNHDLYKPMVLKSSLYANQGANTLPYIYVHNPEELDNALLLAQEQRKPVMLYFYADWCTSCKTMERTVFTDQKVQKLLNGVILIKADLTDYNQQARELMQQYQVFGPPAFFFFGPNGKIQQHYTIVGDKPVCEFTEHLESWQTSH